MEHETEYAPFSFLDEEEKLNETLENEDDGTSEDSEDSGNLFEKDDSEEEQF